MYDEATGGDIPGRLEYYHKDHLGNVRLTFSNVNQDGAISVGSIYDPNNEIVLEKHYYPFGLDMTGAWFATVAPDNAYRYNGKELDEATGLYDYGARYYDPAIARWGQVDPLAEEYVSVSPYAYVANNPLLYIDPDGMRIIIRDLDGKIVEYSRGMDQSEDYSEYINQTIQSLNYIAENGGKKEINRLVDTENRTYKIGQTEDFSSDSFNPHGGGGNITFNSTQVNEYLTEDGEYETITTVTILAHEIDHASENERLMQIGEKSGDYSKVLDFQSALNAAPDDKRRDNEESRAINGLERKIARSLGQYLRKSHKEIPVDKFNSGSPLKDY
ncbi:MAG: RHS repeat-associated core domain-containing protein [Bacteroidota bacterium]